MREFSKRLEERANLERAQQEDFVNDLREAFFEQQIQEFEAVNNMSQLIKGKFQKSMAAGFKVLKG